MAQDKSVPIEQRVFAKNFKIARQAINLTQTEISTNTGLAQDYISNVERCVAGTGLDSMIAMSHAVKVPLYHLLHTDFHSTFSSNEASKVWSQYAKHFSAKGTIPFERELFGQNFKAARLKAKLTQMDITKLTGFPNDSLVYVEKGETSVFLNTASRLATAIGIPVHTLLTP
jgi:transcriptional regulator with XRE-family HTH domain